MIRAFIQARMSSQRFPGKVLAPLQGRPIIMHVIDRVKQAIPPQLITVLTSSDEADDPLACYVQQNGVAVFRGPLNNVAGRFRLCLRESPCDWILRVNADSPLLDVGTVRRVLEYENDDSIDLATTTFPRTFPKGQNAELIRVEPFLEIDQAEMSAEEKEHVTLFYYRRPQRFHIVNLTSGNPRLAETSLVVDTIEDLRRLENNLSDGTVARQEIIGGMA